MFKEFKNFKEGLTYFFMFLLLEKTLNVTIGAWCHILSVTVYDNGAKEVFVKIIETSPYHTASLLLGLAFIEELFFRLFPTTVVLVCLKKFAFLERRRNEIILISLILSSVVFGYIHGSYINILFQGLSGALYFIFFWKSLGYASGNLFAALASSTLLHFSSNVMTLSILSIARN